jgi:hypothetical protein
MQRALWPHVRMYDKQWEVVESVELDGETVVHAGNMLGKDFVTAFIVLWFFLSRYPCRIVTTSVDHSQLEAVLWGEIRRFIQTCVCPLVYPDGPLLVNHLHIRRMFRGSMCPLSYIIGRTAAKGEGMLGHHIADTGDKIPRTLFVADEASGMDDETYEKASTWARRKLIIGNPYDCDTYFKKAVTEGTVAA